MYAAIIAFGVLIFPVFINVLIYYNADKSKAFFVITVFKTISFGGYLSVKKGNIFIHVSDKKAFSFKLIDIKSMFDGNINVLKFVEITKIIAFIDLPISSFSMIGAVAVNFVSNAILPIYIDKKPFVNAKSRVTLKNEGDLTLFFETGFVFNLVCGARLLFDYLRKRK